MSFAVFIISIFAGSVGPEREFSRMGYMITPRRSSYTASNAHKRLTATLSNLISQKRRLENVLDDKIKTKLFTNQ